MNVYAIPLPDDEAPGRLALQTALASLSSLFGERLQTRPAVLVSSSELALDGLMLALGALPVAGEVVAARQYPTASPAPEAAAKPRRTRKQNTATPVDPAPLMVCSQCSRLREPTKSGICKPCAMKNAKAAKKDPAGINHPVVDALPDPASVMLRPGNDDARFSEPQIFTEDRQAEKRILARHGAIRGRKLG